MLDQVALEGESFSTGIRNTEEDNIELYKKYVEVPNHFSREWLNILQDPLTLTMENGAKASCSFPVSEPRLGFSFKRIGLEGRIVDIEECILPPGQATADNSLSVNRQMASSTIVTGRTGRMPFTPGGIEITLQSNSKLLHSDKDGLLDIPPGFTRGLALETRQSDIAVDSLHEVNTDENEESVVGIELGHDIDKLEVMDQFTSTDDGISHSIDSLLPDEISFLRVKSDQLHRPKAKTWAHLVDINRDVANFSNLVPHPARTWPFELDNFQKEAIYHMEQGDSVFVAAHTSAGKTVIAEYAMAMARQNMTKCIYTSPIKALSNQKYRDFSTENEDVGILTGDVQLNPDASVLIMTTEILRSMLYRGADVIRDVEFVIFDEVHYVNDSERGVVWEEVIIMLPEHVNFVLLSATVPNTFEFANWIGRTKQKDIYVVSTPKRPVPLRHFLWAKKSLYEVVDENGQLVTSGYAKYSSLFKSESSVTKPVEDRKKISASGSQKSGAHPQRKQHEGSGSKNKSKALNATSNGGKKNAGSAKGTELRELIYYLKNKTLLPAVVFVFSRKFCEQHALSLRSMDFNNRNDRSAVHRFIEQAVARLRTEDRKLPQIEMMRELLTRGIGVHHSGLLPIMKEVVEILFAKGLVKLLFATETFAMGLNLPTRTVIFESYYKFDSKTRRRLHASEYIQMAGRAGRRGLDKIGTVIILAGNEQIFKNTLQQMVMGQPMKLSSQFRITYSMILSILRTETLNVEDVIMQSFSENASFVLKPEKEKQLKLLKSSRQALLKRHSNIDETVVSFTKLTEEYARLTERIYRPAVYSGIASNKFCLYRANNGSYNIGVLSFTRTDPLIIHHVVRVTRTEQFLAEQQYTIPFIQNTVFSQKSLKLVISKAAQGNHRLPISSILYIFNDGMSGHKVSRKQITDYVQSGKMEELLSSEWKELDFNSLKSLDARKALTERSQICENLVRMSQKIEAHYTKDFSSQIFSVARELSRIDQAIEDAETELVAQNTELLPDYAQRIAVLKDALYIDDGLDVLIKGRVTCEISTGFELYITELLFENFLAHYEPEEIVALLSAFVYEGSKGIEDPESVTPRLDDGKERLLKVVYRVNDLCLKHQVILTQDELEFVDKNRFALMHVVYEWARGMNFSDIMKLTELQEGTIVRVINRLDEVCRAVMSASRIMGDITMYEKLSIAQEKIKRDIVFCSSLYL